MLKVGDKVQFILGDTPLLGTILFAVGTGIAVRLASGAEMIINPDLITRTL
jgi:hypothetical protein